MFSPRLDILPEPQQLLWPELGSTPRDLILYGGTAIALRLGHRPSVDFDFFSFEPFVPGDLLAAIPYLHKSAVLQSAVNTLTCRVDRSGPVQLSFFGGLSLGQVATPEAVSGPGFAVAMPIDLGGTKVALVTQRAEAKDYVDVHALLGAGLSLPEMLAAALVIYGGTFSPLLALKALSYYEEPALARLPKGLRGGRDGGEGGRPVAPSVHHACSPARGKAMTPVSQTPELLDLARRIVWFEPPAEALGDQVRFLAYLMTYGTAEDVAVARRYFSEKDFRDAVENAPPGILDGRSWAYWNLMVGRYPAPPMPGRHLPE